MGPIWGRQDPGGPHVGPMILAIWAVYVLGKSFCDWEGSYERSKDIYDFVRIRVRKLLSESVQQSLFSKMATGREDIDCFADDGGFANAFADPAVFYKPSV